MIKLPEDLNDKSFGFIADKFQCTPLQAQFILVGCNYTIAEAQRLNATAQPVSGGWIKCSERMPVQHQSNHYVPLNLLLNERTVVQGGFDDGEFWMDGVVINNVTRWMPLPAAPGGQDD